MTKTISLLSFYAVLQHTVAFTFHVHQHTHSPMNNIVQSSNALSRVGVSLFARSRKDMLRELAGDDSAVRSKSVNKRKTKRGSAARTSVASAKKGSPVISADLAEWAASTGETGKVEDVAKTEEDSPKLKNNKKKLQKEEKKLKQMQRRAESEAMREKEALIIESLGEIFQEEERDLNVILDRLRELSSLQGTEMRRISAGSTRVDFKMVWAGSDAAICHLGSGLHKVPLARLQEVFMTIGKKRIEVNEVIRILGPFPNVKNILKGDTAVEKDILNVKYTSMVDGTGKEILAGKAENVQRLSLDVVYASDEAIIFAVPDELRDEVFDDNGSSLLVFFKEEDINYELEALRVL